MKKRSLADSPIYGIPICLALVALVAVFGCAQKNWDVLSDREQKILHRILSHWKTWVPAKEKDGTAPLVTFEELYQGLAGEERQFLDRVRAMDPKKSFGFQGNYLGNETAQVSFKRLGDQWIEKNGTRTLLDPQYLPEKVHAAYREMMRAMQQDLGKKLWVESGYRSPAYQLHTFLDYLPKHHYSLAETGRWIALPGYSEHGAPQHQAIDFINEQGINGEDHVEDFEKLPEYTWLLQHAGQFGFELSYPRDKKGITFEPWHWRYERN